MMLSMMLENGETQQNLEPVVIESPASPLPPVATEPPTPEGPVAPETPIQRTPKSTHILVAPPKKNRRSKLKMKESGDKVS